MLVWVHDKTEWRQIALRRGAKLPTGCYTSVTLLAARTARARCGAGEAIAGIEEGLAKRPDARNASNGMEGVFKLLEEPKDLKIKKEVKEGGLTGGLGESRKRRAESSERGEAKRARVEENEIIDLCDSD